MVGIGGQLGGGGGTGRERVCIGWVPGVGVALKSLFFVFFFFFFDFSGFLVSGGLEMSRVGRHLPSPGFPCSRRIIIRCLRRILSLCRHMLRDSFGGWGDACGSGGGGEGFGLDGRKEGWGRGLCLFW